MNENIGNNVDLLENLTGKVSTLKLSDTYTQVLYD